MGGRGPLEGIRVVDLSMVVSGPFATLVLAEQGAEVVKVEPIGDGDPMRLVPIRRGGFSSLNLNLNHGKRSLAVNLAAEAGRDVVLDLIADADVVVQNFRPGVVDRLGIGYEAAASRRPDIVYASISGYGTDGPYADRPVYDPVIQSISGIVARQQSEEIPIPDLVRNVMVDKATALNVAQSVCAALVGRATTGRGTHLEISMLDVAVHFFWPDGMADFTFVGDGVEGGPRIVDQYRLTQCSDAPLIYFVGTEEHVRGLFRAIHRPELCDDPRYITREGRREGNNLEVLGGILEAQFATLPMRDTLQRLHDHGVPAGPINQPDEVLADPQIVERGTLITWDHPTAGTVRQPRNPVLYSGEPLPFADVAAEVGEHTDAILTELGRSAEQIADLRAAGAVG
ncbi:MAG: CoA transferase [Actinomycetota bacterium]